MTLKFTAPFALCAVFAAWTALAGQKASPVFEVVSIKPRISDGKLIVVPNGWTPFLPGGRYRDPSVNLMMLITYAYGVSRPEIRIEGLPAWAASSFYSVEAVPGDEFREVPAQQQHSQVQLMLQAMLADRFQLKLHVEDRQVDVYELHVAPGGLKKMTPSEEGIAKPGLNPGLNAAMGDSGGRMIANGASMRNVADSMGIFLKRLVVDKTGVDGFYNFDIRWTALKTPGSPPPAGGLGADGISMVISELRDQLGLRVVSAKGLEHFWIVDHAEKPNGQ